MVSKNFGRNMEKKFKVGQFKALFLRKMIECVELLEYIKKDTDDYQEDIFGVWIQK